MLLLSVVIGGGWGWRFFKAWVCSALKSQMNSGRQLGSIHCHVLHLLKDIFHLFSFVLSVWRFHWTQTWTKPATGPTDLQTRAYQNQTCVIYRSDREPQPWFHDSQLPWNLHSQNMKVDGSRQISAPAGFFASLYFCSHTWSLAGPCTCSGMQMITATRSGVYIYIYRERGELAFNTSEGRVSNVSRVYQKPNLYLLCVPSEAERPAFDAGAVWWCNWWESSEESPTASEEFDYLHPLSAQWAIVRLAICHPFHLHRQHLPCLFMPSCFLGAVFHGGGGREKGWLFLQNALILQVQRTYWAATARLMFNIV